MRPFTTIALIGCSAGLILPGCSSVPQSRYDDLLTSYRTQQEETIAWQSKYESSEETVNLLRGQVSTATQRINSLTGDNNRLNTDVETLASDYDAMIERLNRMELGPLPADLDEALQRLAAAHPGVLTFDSQLGMVRFASDFTFDLGSVALKSEAVTTLQSLAEILNSDTASVFEVRVVGHTDNVRIAKPDTRAKHPTNRHLSVHRAIAVGEALSAADLDPRRIMVSGYGEYRPIVQNNATGAPENRRVEIFLQPMHMTLADLPASTGTTTGAARVEEDADPLK